MAKVYNCSVCDYCYSNSTMDNLYLCTNGNSDYLGEFVDGNGLGEDDMECVVVNGKDHDSLIEDEELDDEDEDGLSIYRSNLTI